MPRQRHAEGQLVLGKEFEPPRPDYVPAITLPPLEAILIAIGAVRFLVRDAGTDLRGELVICSAKELYQADFDRCCQEKFKAALVDAGFRSRRDLPLAKALASVKLLDVAKVDPRPRIDHLTDLEIEAFDWRPGRFCWSLGRVRRFKTPQETLGICGPHTIASVAVDRGLL